jgi:hypothetical protein
MLASMCVQNDDALRLRIYVVHGESKLELLTFFELRRQTELRIEKGQVAALAAPELEVRLGQGDGAKADVRDEDDELTRPLVAGRWPTGEGTYVRGGGPGGTLGRQGRSRALRHRPPGRESLIPRSPPCRV